MSDRYAPMIATAHDFYAGLARDNTKTWWEAHKTIYDRQLKGPALELLEEMTPILSEMTGDPVKTKLFRPYRDVRFSADKTPYKEHLHVLWSIEGGGRQDPAFFFGIGPEDVTVGGGLMGFSPEVLTLWRKFIDLDGPHMQATVDAARDKGFVFWEPELKRTPPPFPADHPQADLLRMKSFVAHRPLNGNGTTVECLTVAFREILPINQMLMTVACA